MQTQHYDVVGAIMAYEQGDLDNDEMVELFQHLVDDGTIYHLQGSYQRTASALEAVGLIHRDDVHVHTVH